MDFMEEPDLGDEEEELAFSSYSETGSSSSYASVSSRARPKRKRKRRLTITHAKRLGRIPDRLLVSSESQKDIDSLALSLIHQDRWNIVKKILHVSDHIAEIASEKKDIAETMWDRAAYGRAIKYLESCIAWPAENAMQLLNTRHLDYPDDIPDPDVLYVRPEQPLLLGDDDDDYSPFVPPPSSVKATHAFLSDEIMHLINAQIKNTPVGDLRPEWLDTETREMEKKALHGRTIGKALQVVEALVAGMTEPYRCPRPLSRSEALFAKRFGGGKPIVKVKRGSWVQVLHMIPATHRKYLSNARKRCAVLFKTQR
ncbi:hypothetical protein SeMB42_g01155 [Synchytrium endobioticum]|uniref:Uncharacterized protein n=1 Tax=Synchytrium endobioticum TaxID=286115 RepID=A0A507DMS8_9FUNG|nr:hypothetical protein SeMB42_g01155 [Synchytrium endobioticum]